MLRAQRGDRSALQKLLVEAVPVVSALVRALAPELRNREDIVQEALLRVMSHLKSLRDPDRFGAYLNEITYFLECVETGAEPERCTPESTRDTIALIDREIESIEGRGE